MPSVEKKREIENILSISQKIKKISSPFEKKPKETNCLSKYKPVKSSTNRGKKDKLRKVDKKIGKVIDELNKLLGEENEPNEFEIEQQVQINQLKNELKQRPTLQELEEAKKALNELLAKRAEMQEAIDELKAENRKLKERRKDSGYEEEIENPEVERLRRREKSLEEWVNKLETRLNELSNDLIEKNNRNQTTLEQLRNEWQTDKKRLENQKKNLTAENRELHERIEQFEEELVAEKKKHEDYLNKYGNLRILAEDRKKSLKIQNLQTEIDSLKVELEDEKQTFQRQINDLNEQIDSLSTKVKNYRRKSIRGTTYLQNKLNKTVKEKGYIQTELSKLQEDFYETVEENKQKDRQILDLENKLSEKGRTIQEIKENEKLKEENKELHASWERDVKDLEAELDQLINVNSETQRGINSDTSKNSLGWKSALWQKTKKFGLTALAAYGSYQVGYNYGFNSCSTQISQPHSLVQLNNTSFVPQTCPANWAHSQVENPLLNPFFSDNFHSDLSNFPPPPPPSTLSFPWK